eukprot:GHVS01065126.1.p2 GENE.GHVS01065126.1~~GHVS01065126.1.p2  ORF type:complete len:440 (-),score=70.92 GHVS01065126.1:1665-2984(-)
MCPCASTTSSSCRKWEDRLHVVTVATHEDGYYKALVQSAARLDIPLKVLGFGKRWEGFRWKFEKVLEYARDVEDDAIVMFVDGFDSVLLQPRSVILARFLHHRVPFLATGESCERFGWAKLFFQVAHDGMFGGQPGDGWPEYADKSVGLKLLNSGGYIGYKKAVIDILGEIPDDEVNDQRWLSKLYREGNHGIGLDARADVFHLWRTMDDAKVVSYEDARQMCPYNPPFEGRKREKKEGWNNVTEGQQGEENSIPHEYSGETSKTLLGGVLVDIKTRQAPCAAHIHCRRNIDTVMTQLFLPQSSTLLHPVHYAWYCWYSTCGSLGGSSWVALLLSTICFVIGSVVSSLALLCFLFFTASSHQLDGGSILSQVAVLILFLRPLALLMMIGGALGLLSCYLHVIHDAFTWDGLRRLTSGLFVGGENKQGDYLNKRKVSKTG